VFKLFGDKPDHPLHSLAEAKLLLSQLPHDNPKESLEEITFWLESIKSAAGFSPELRTEIILLLDETGQPLLTKLLHQFLSVPRLRDVQGTHLWQGIHAFTKALSDTYSSSIREYQQAKNKPTDISQRIPLICVRQLLAVSGQLKLELMQYIEIDSSVWQQMWFCYQFSETEGCTESMVPAYAGQTILTSPKRELLRALVLYISSPGTLAADQIELSYRIAGRLANSFELKKVAEAACPYQFDLSAYTPPHKTDSNLAASLNTRFFGAVRALPALKEIIEKIESGTELQERHFGNEFTSAGELIVLKHLMNYWGSVLPYRLLERRGISASIEVAHGFRVISRVVTELNAGNIADQGFSALTKGQKIDLADDTDIDFTTEEWNVSDMSMGGIGATLTGRLGNWAKIGSLCALKPHSGQQWWIGMIRRLRTCNDKKINVGIQLLSKYPASVELLILGKGAEDQFNWETDSGLFAIEYLPVILLPDASKSYINATMLMEAGHFVLGGVFQIVVEEQSRHIKITKLLAKSEDYEHVEFEWMKEESNALES